MRMRLGTCRTTASMTRLALAGLLAAGDVTDAARGVADGTVGELAVTGSTEDRLDVVIVGDGCTVAPSRADGPARNGPDLRR